MAKADGPQVSGKVFRFLSAMHPALSKSERKRYAGFDPEQWYSWTPEVSAEFTDLMRRSPRDTSFARGFAYVAQRAVPEGSYIPTTVLLQNIAQLPAAFQGPTGTGFQAQVDRPGHATVRYVGMPGFANVCIAIQGELTQRLQASGAQSVVVKHGSNCRVNGADSCDFEVEWSGEAAPPDTTAVNVRDMVGDDAVEDAPPAAAAPKKSAPESSPASENGSATSAVKPTPAPQARTAEPAAMSAASADPSASSASAAGAGMSATTELAASQATADGAEDLFQQLRKRLAEADRQAKLYAEAQQEIDKLRVDLSRMKAQAEADVAQAQKERSEAIEALAGLKKRVREIVSDE